MRKLIVSNLPDDIDENELSEMFREYGLETVILRPGKYAVLTFSSDFAALKAMEEQKGKVLLRGHWLRMKMPKRFH